MVEIFKTNVAEAGKANELIEFLNQHFPQSKINFDLDDCDKILRMEGLDFNPEAVERLFRTLGLRCEILD